ncbi:hypothetical protein S83_041290 [Arachis hypogaea]
MARNSRIGPFGLPLFPCDKGATTVMVLQVKFVWHNHVIENLPLALITTAIYPWPLCILLKPLPFNLAAAFSGQSFHFTTCMCHSCMPQRSSRLKVGLMGDEKGSLIHHACSSVKRLILESPY